MNHHCRYCGHDDTTTEEGTVSCLGCGAQWTVEAPWQHFCILCGLYVDYVTKCKQGCPQREGVPAWMT